MSDPERRELAARRARTAGHSVYRTAVDVVLTGIVVIVPLVVTLYVLNAALNIIASALSPVIKLLQYFGVISGIRNVGAIRFLLATEIIGDATAFVTELIAVALLAVVIVVVGSLAHFQYGERVIDYFDYLITIVPGVGTVYKSFRRMGDVMLESGVENFREVKLVEFPREGVFVLGFVTNRAPLPVQDAAEVEGMTTLFLPLAPNPVMGGFLTYIPDDRVRDVEMDVQEAVQTIVTSGIATEEPDGDYRHLSREELERLNAPGHVPTVHDDE